MELKKQPRWNTWASIVYAAGVWTIIGSYFYFRYTGKYDDLAVQPPNTEEDENPNRVIHKTAHSTSVIIYKENFVPLSTRISNLINSFTGGAGPESGDRGK